MKKLLFAAYSLDIGGIETALVTLLNKLQEKDYEITLVLEQKEGIFLKELDERIKVISYTPNNDENEIKRKIKNFINRMKFALKYKNRFDFSASFATYSNSSSFVARTASKNCYLWGHADYLSVFDNNEEEMKEFFEEKKYNKFKKIIFVSKEGAESFVSVFPLMKEKTIVCNNLIDGEKINNLANEEIDLKKDEITTFINVGRHDEHQKRLTRIIEASKILKEKNKKFKILFVGDGDDNEKYNKMVNRYELQDKIVFLGK